MIPPSPNNIQALFQNLYKKVQEATEEKEEDEEDQNNSYETCDSWHLLHGLKGPGSETRCNDEKLRAMIEDEDE